MCPIVVCSETHQLQVVLIYAWSHALHLNEFETVATLLSDLLGEVLDNGKSSFLMVIVLKFDVSRLGQLNT